MQCLKDRRGIRFYVLPVRPWLHEALHLPHRVDVLVTHGAPLGILDDNGRWGCPILRKLVDEAQPQIHIFGHCHQYGMQEITIGKTMFFNAAINNKGILFSGNSDVVWHSHVVTLQKNRRYKH